MHNTAGFSYKKSIMKHRISIYHSYIFILVLFFLGGTSLPEASAQIGKKEDVVTLREGTVIFGYILEQEVGKYVRLELVGGSILVIEQEKIESIDRAPSRFRRVSRSYNHRLSPIFYREKGIYSYISPQFSFRDGADGSRVDVGIHLRLGYRLNRFMALGMGVGVDNYEGGVYMPVYMELSGDLLRNRVTPHYYASVGYSSGISPSWPNDRIEGGITTFVGLGYKVHTQTKFEWTVVGGYKLQDSSERENSFGAPGASIPRNIRREGLTLQISIGF